MPEIFPQISRVHSAPTQQAQGGPFFQAKSRTNQLTNRIQREGVMDSIRDTAHDIATHILPGSVTNHYTSPVTVWSGDFGRGGCTEANYRQVRPGATMGGVMDWLDIDHLRAPNGRWFKIGSNHAVVNRNGSVSNAKCQVTGCGEDCRELTPRPQRQRFLDGSYIDDRGNWQPGIGPKI